MDRMVPHRAASQTLGTQFILCWVCVFVFFVAPSFGYTTKSPVVTKMVDKAVAYLKSASHNEPGGMALIGMAIWKNEKTKFDPKVTQMAEAVAAAARGGAEGMDIYSTGISLIFLASYDSSKYEEEVKRLLKALEKKQKEHGGWGYPDLKTGDTSMTQYGVLGTWEAKKHRFKVSQSMIDNVAKWLLKTQDPTGAYGYQGHISKDGKLMSQEGVRHSMAAAGMGSIYICADLLDMTPSATRKGGKLDPALTEVKDEEDGEGESKSTKKKKVKTSVSRDMIRSAMARGNGWFEKNLSKGTDIETYYYMYALERYQSFRELSEGKDYDHKKVDGPKWYNDGVDFLKKAQNDDGTWDCPGQCKEVVNTAFGVLFLLRSTKGEVHKVSGYGDGTMVGGTGLPKEGEFLHDGRVIKKTTLGPFAAMKVAMDKLDAQGLEDAAARIEHETKGKGSNLLTSEHERLFKQQLSNPNPAMRQAAINMLVLKGNLDNVPMLILALNDKDTGVVLAARDGLRKLTRRFQGFGLPEDSTADERRLAMEKWKAWYLTVRPNTEF